MIIQEAIKILKEIHPMFSQPATHHGGASCFFGVSYLRNYGKLMDKAIALLESDPCHQASLTGEFTKEISLKKCETAWKEFRKSCDIRSCEKTDHPRDDWQELRGVWAYDIFQGGFNAACDIIDNLKSQILNLKTENDRLTASLRLSEHENEHLELKAKAFEEANKLYSEAEEKYEARIKELEGQQKMENENG